MTSRTVVRALALALIALFASASTASANTQQWSEPDESSANFEGKELDLQSVTISQNETEALFEAEIEYPSPGAAPHDQVQIFVDTNGDGAADRAVGFLNISSSQYTVEVREVSMTPANCQRLGNALYTSSPISTPAPDGAGRRLLQAPFAASHLGASSYKWAAYVLNDSFTRAGFDYLPNEANPDPARQNPVSDDFDGCEVDGDGDFDDPGNDTFPDRAFPVDMTKGHQYGAATTGGGTGGGSTDGGGSGRPAPAVIRGLPLLTTTPIGPPQMPRLTPKDGKSTDFITVTEAEKRLRALKVPFTLRLVPLKSSDAETTKQAKYLRSKGKGDEVLFQKPLAGKELKPSESGTPPKISLQYYDAADDIRDRNKNCDLRSTALAKKALRGKTQDEAEFELRRLDCTATWTEAPAFGIDRPEVTSARKLGNGSIELTLGMPRNAQDLLLIVRENPHRTKSTDLSFTDNWRLVRSRSSKNPSRISVQVVERATGRFVQGALVAVSDGDEEVETDISDANGEAELVIPFGEAGRRTLYAVYNGRNGNTSSGWRHLFVADLKGKAFTTASGRQMKSSKGVYKASAASTTAAKRMRYSPATAGAGAAGTEIVAPNIVQVQSMTLFADDRHPAKVAPSIAPHGALDIPRTGSVLVCATTGSVISVAGQSGGSPSEACARTVRAIWAAAVANIGTVRSELVAPHGATLQQDAQAAEQAGVGAPGTPSADQVALLTVAAGHLARQKGDVHLPGLSLTSTVGSQLLGTPLIGQAGGNFEPGGKIISEAGGVLIGNSGSTVISDNGLGIISDNGAAFIGTNTGNFVATNGGTFRQNSISLLPANTFGPIPTYGGNVIGQDVGS